MNQQLPLFTLDEPDTSTVDVLTLLRNAATLLLSPSNM